MATLAWSLTDGSIVHDESGYIHSDARGSVVAKTSLDAADVRMPDRKAEYEAWGQTLAYDGVALPRYQFTNEEPDPSSGYYYFGARPYDPTLSRWLAPDPLLIGDLDIDAHAGTQLNLYAYAANNPVTRIDPGGHFALPLIFVAPAVIDVAIGVVGVAAAALGIAAYQQHESNSEGPSTAPPPLPPTSFQPPVGPSGTPKPSNGGDVGAPLVGKLASDSLANRDTGAPVAAAAAGGGGDGGDGSGGNNDAKKRGAVSGDGAASAASGGGGSRLQPGTHAGQSIPAIGPRVTASQKEQLTRIGQQTGCHSCGTKDFGTRSGKPVGDHQPPTALKKPGDGQELYPHCASCSAKQGAEVQRRLLNSNGGSTGG